MLKRIMALSLMAIMLLALAVSVGAQGETYTIGVSNSFVGSEWRTQMIQNLEDVAAQIEEEKGITIDLVIESADTDVSGQVQQIQNLVNRGVDAIIVNPGDVAGLNSALEEAVEEGVVVIAIDQEIAAEGVINVVIDQNEWAKVSARWLAEALGGEGDIVLIEGFVGHPANEARMAGVEEVLAEYPGINVVGRESGMWDQATGQQVMSDFLASISNIDGVWTQDGMATGVLTAVQTANPDEWPIISGEARASYMQQWNDILAENPDFRSIGVVNPPGIAATGLRVAIELLEGREINPEAFQGEAGNTLYVPLAEPVTSENFATVFEEQGIADQPASYTLDQILTQEQAVELMDTGTVAELAGDAEGMEATPEATAEG